MSICHLRKEAHHDRLVACHAERPADLFTMFVEAVRRSPQAVAAVDGDTRWSYADLAGRVERCAEWLTSLGLATGDRIAILLDNRADYVTLLLAVARLGLVAVPMNIRQRAPETAHALEDSGAYAIIHDDDLSAHLPDRAALPTVRRWLPYGEQAPLWDGPPALVRDLPERSAAQEDDPFCILYTSGTTGRPKGAVLTHFGVVSSCLGSRDHLRMTDGESMVLSVPASHVTGIVLVLWLSVCVAGKVVMQRSFQAREFLEFAQGERVTYAIMVPAMYKLCLMEEDYADFDLSAWRIGAYGGAPMAGATIDALARLTPRLTLVNIYGSTETSSPAVMMPLGEGRSRPDQVGRALPYADRRAGGILDRGPDDSTALLEQ
jgi:acyl-CoA synthetase (AMP-forming)/AMP-acid ligase II